jgi:hypothetical protein
MFEKRMLRRIFAAQRVEVRGEWRKLRIFRSFEIVTLYLTLSDGLNGECDE